MHCRVVIGSAAPRVASWARMCNAIKNGVEGIENASFAHVQRCGRDGRGITSVLKDYASYSTAAKPLGGYVIKEETIDHVFADRKRMHGNEEIYDLEDKNIPEHYIETLQHSDNKLRSIIFNEPLEQVSKDQKLNPDDYTTEDMEALKAKGVRTTVEDPDYYKKKYTRVQALDIMQQGITIEMPVLPQVIPDKPFEQMSASEFKSYASEHMTRRLMSSKVKIPKPRVNPKGAIYEEAIMNASAAEVDRLLLKSKDEATSLKERLKEKNVDDMARAEWEAVLSLEDQLKRLIEDEDKIYEPMKPESPPMKTVLWQFTLLFIGCFLLLSVATPGTRALVWKPLITKLRGEVVSENK